MISPSTINNKLKFMPDVYTIKGVTVYPFDLLSLYQLLRVLSTYDEIRSTIPLNRLTTKTHHYVIIYKARHAESKTRGLEPTWKEK